MQNYSYVRLNFLKQNTILKVLIFVLKLVKISDIKTEVYIQKHVGSLLDFAWKMRIDKAIFRTELNMAQSLRMSVE